MNERVQRLMRIGYQYQHLNYQTLFPEVSHGEWILLVSIKKQAESEEMPFHSPGTGKFAKMLSCSPPMISKMFRSLEKKGYIIRRIDENDRRNTNVFLTEQGEELLETGKARMDVLFDKVVERFGEEQMDELLNIMEEFCQVMREELEEKQ